MYGIHADFQFEHGAVVRVRGVTKEERALLRKTVAECKAEAKEKRLKWRERRKWVRSCVTVKLEKHPGVNVQELLRTYPDLENMPKADVRNPV